MNANMCGLIFVKRLDGKFAQKMVLKRYASQRTRGHEGFGYIGLYDGKVIEFERRADEDEIKDLIEDSIATEIIFHHRFPTSAPNFDQTAHPIRVSHPSLKHDYYVIHNGVVWEDDELKKKHEAEGYKYTTEIETQCLSGGKVLSTFKQWNDSEALAIELAKDLDAGGSGISVQGSIAFICLQTQKGSRKAENVYFGRNYSNPLKAQFVADHFIAITSEGDGESVKAHTLYKLNYTNGKLTERPYNVGDEATTTAKATAGYATEDMHYDEMREWGGYPEYDHKGHLKAGAKAVKDIFNENDYFSNLAEREDLKRQLASEKMDEEERLYVEARILELTEVIEDMEEAELNSVY